MFLRESLKIQMELWNQGYGEYKGKNNRVCFFLNMPDYFLYGNILLIWIYDGAYLKLSAVLLPLSVLRCSGKEYISR